MGFEGFILHPVADKGKWAMADAVSRKMVWVDETTCLMARRKKKGLKDKFHPE